MILKCFASLKFNLEYRKVIFLGLDWLVDESGILLLQPLSPRQTRH